MSEIYNGTFVLGNTSATTLSAGPGIKIDESTPGVIKVSNDETVLYNDFSKIGTDPANGHTITLSEPCTNFEKIGIYAARFNTERKEGIAPFYNEFDSYPGGSAAKTFNIFGSFEAEASVFLAGGIYSGVNDTTWTALSGYQFTLGGSIDRSKFYANAYKIIGINRKQNGGN